MDKLFWGSMALIAFTALLGVLVHNYQNRPKEPKGYEICGVQTCYQTKRYERVYECIKFIDYSRRPITLCGYSSMTTIYEK